LQRIPHGAGWTDGTCNRSLVEGLACRRLGRETRLSVVRLDSSRNPVRGRPCEGKHGTNHEAKRFAKAGGALRTYRSSESFHASNNEPSKCQRAANPTITASWLVAMAAMAGRKALDRCCGAAFVLASRPSILIRPRAASSGFSSPDKAPTKLQSHSFRLFLLACRRHGLSPSRIRSELLLVTLLRCTPT
jgi:hypothetical protein